MICPVHFLANPELFFFFTASHFALFSVMAHPSRSHNSQSVSENLFPLSVYQVLGVYDRQPDLSPDAMELSCFFFWGGGSKLFGEKNLYSPHPVRLG